MQFWLSQMVRKTTLRRTDFDVAVNRDSVCLSRIARTLTQWKGQVDLYMFCPVENLVQFQNRTTLLPVSEIGYPVIELAALFKNWTSTLVFRVNV